MAGKSQASSSRPSGFKGPFVVVSILRNRRHLYGKPATPPTNQNQAFIVTECRFEAFAPTVFEKPTRICRLAPVFEGV
jgi:hypothetical protein